VLLFNMAVSRALKARYQWAIGTLPILFTFAGFIPLIALASWSTHIFGMTMHEPVRTHSNGWLWLTLFIAAMVAFMLAGCFIGYVLNGIICQTFYGWSGEKVREVFWESKVPSEWLKDSAALETSAKELDRLVEKGGCGTLYSRAAS